MHEVCSGRYLVSSSATRSQRKGHTFESKKATLENILVFEEAVDMHEKTSEDVVQDDLKISTFLNQQDGQLRQHMLLNMQPDTRYSSSLYGAQLLRAAVPVAWTPAVTWRASSCHILPLLDR